MELKNFIASTLLGLTIGCVGLGIPLSNVKSENKEMKQEYEQTIEDMNISHNDIVSNLRNEITGLNNQLTVISAQKSDLENNISILTAQVTTLKEQKITIENNLANIETQLANANTELNSLNSQLIEKENLLNEKQTALNNAIANGELQAEEIANKQVEITNLQTNISTLNEEKTELENKVERLQNLVSLYMNMKDNLLSQVNTLSSERDNLQVQLITKTEELATLTTQLEEANNRIAELEASVNVRVSYDIYDKVAIQFMHPTEGWGGAISLREETREPTIRAYRFLDCLVNYNTCIDIQQIKDTRVYDSDNNFIASHSVGTIVCSSEIYGECEYELNLTFVDKEGNVVDINTLNQDMHYSLYYKTYSIETDSNNSHLLTKLDVTIVIEEYVG